MIARLLDEARHHAVAVERCVEIVSGDEEILASLLLSEDVAGAARVELQLTSEKISRLRQDEMIDPHPDDSAGALQGRQRLLEELDVFRMHSHRLTDG